MPTITQNIDRDYLTAYDGFDKQQVGMGLMNPNAYSTPSYQKKKIKSIAIGLVSDVAYGGAENDRTPRILPMFFESPYNTLLAYNLNYGTQKLRQAMLKFIVDTNAGRIRDNKPIIVDYYSLKRAIPDSQYIVRRYKVVGLTPFETYPIVEWANLVKEKTRFDGYYKKFK